MSQNCHKCAKIAVMNKPKVCFKTFGCRTNAFDTQVMMQNLHGYEVTHKESEADIIIINSCTVTNGAERGVRQYLNRIEQEKKKVYFTGCGIEGQGAKFLEEGRLNGVFGHSEKERIGELLESGQTFYLPGNKESMDSTLVEQMVGKTRAFLKIQEGCDFSCAYCIIPSVRGGARSQKESRILDQVRKLADSGYSEVVLTGTNTGSYGKDSGTSLAQLIKAMANINGIRRIRLGSLEPSQVDDALIDLLDAPFMAKHLHIALQHSSDTMLEIMNRKNRIATDVKLFEKIADKNVALGTDYIVGHPGESEAVFEEAWQNFKELPLTHIHLFTYSMRDGTPSAKRKDTVIQQIAKERLSRLKQYVGAQNIRFRQQNRAPLRVLLEQGKNGVHGGLDQFFNRIEICGTIPENDSWLTVHEYEVLNEKNLARF